MELETPNQIEELLHEVEQLRKENAELQRRLESALTRSRAKSTGINGFIIRTPTPFTGEFAGVMFKDGQAFVPDTRVNIADMMRKDFGYEVEFVENYVP